MYKSIFTSLLLLVIIGVSGQDLDRVYNLRGDWKFFIGDKSEYSEKDYDDSGWEEIYVPRRWEREGFNGYDGFAWYRTKIDGDEFEDEGTHYLRLGYIDDVDEVFFNGVKIGFSGSFPPNYSTAWNAKREYRIPTKLIDRNGKNTIAVRVFDKGGEGGIYSGEVGLLVADAAYDEMYSLEGVWKIRTRDREEYAEENYDDTNWQDIIVPSNWKTIGIRDYRGFAWYRKEFDIPEGGKIKEFTLVGGYIDDFDEIFINGVKIGETNDGRRIGRSRSFSELRLYDIPINLLKPGKNTIAVRVEDIGDNGGIYAGPVSIVPSKVVTKFARDSQFWR
ncbi:sugar-binding domain-containing protein [Roseivirga sp.]|uniref:sugar-binding domain-containing protein n=1 Tax=Roseivirga sp. TaxID=1964215 RepID=UPI003B8EA265